MYKYISINIFKVNKTLIYRLSDKAATLNNTPVRSQILQYCKDKGCVSYAAMRKDAVPYFDEDYNVPLVLAIGGEMRRRCKAVILGNGSHHRVGRG